MHFVKILLGFSLAVQIYYLYEFIYSIPDRKVWAEPSEYANNQLRGEFDVSDNPPTGTPTPFFVENLNDNFLEMHMQKPLPQQHPIQTTNDNNTALIYRPATSPGAVVRF